MQVNISIIMPVFNTSKYLKESIRSILQQTYTEFELICVNDASCDDSLEILRELQQQDRRLVIINHEENRGAAVSRNDGLKIAKGAYVIFLDSDDYFYPNMLEVSYQQAINNNADVVIFGSETLENGLLREASWNYQYIDSNERKQYFLPMIRHVPWDKLVRRKILSDYKIWFQEIPTNNDIFYSFAVILMAGKIIVCDKIFLQYRHGRSGSLTNRRVSEENHTVDAFYALFRFMVQNRVEAHLAVVLINLIVDNIQLYLSEETYPLKIRRDSLQNLLEYSDMINVFRRKGMNDILYPHNQEFVGKLIDGMDVCSITYFQYYLDGIKGIIEKRKKKNEKVALWGCGQNGKRLLRLLECHNIAVDYVVDENKQIQGDMYGGYQIRSYDDISKEITTVLITNLAYQKAIESRAAGKEVIYVWK